MDITRSFSKREDIILDKSQFIAALKKAKSLMKYGKAYATSNMGQGKSVMMNWVLKRMGVKNAIMVCPYNLISMWEAYRDKYDLPFIMIISYDTLRGVRPKNGKRVLKHGLLTRDGDSFEITDGLRSLVEDGLVVCADECHMFKNECDTQRAMTAISSYIHQRREIEPGPSSMSGVFFNSTTPLDQEKHCLIMCRTLGIITQPHLMQGTRATGLRELINYCTRMDPIKTDEIVGTMTMNSKNAENIVYSLCIRIILPTIATFVDKVRIPDGDINDMIEELLPTLNVEDLNVMDYPEDEDGGRQTIMNVHCKLDPIPTELIKWGYHLIQPTVRPSVELTQEMKDYYARITDDEVNLDERSGITHGQMTVHPIKIYERTIPMARKVLETVPNSKVVIFVDYKECVRIVQRELAGYGTITITGETTDLSERERLRALFQAPNLDHRVLVTMTQVSATGTEYDDKHGGFPHVGFGLHGFIATNSVQCPGRLNRKTTMSNSLFLYIKVEDEDPTLEESIDKNVSKKSQVFREALLNNGIIPPDSFVDIQYSDDIDYNELLKNAGRPEYKNFNRDTRKTVPIVKRSMSIRQFKSVI
jgi:hypothetical protein